MDGVTVGVEVSVLQHAYKLFYDDMDLCGCGRPETAYSLVRDLLALAPFYERIHGEIAGLIGTEGAYHMVLGMLDHAGLTEHGVSIGGSRLTDKGRWYAEALKKIDDWYALDHVGYPHDGAACTDACWQVEATP